MIIGTNKMSYELTIEKDIFGDSYIRIRQGCVYGNDDVNISLEEASVLAKDLQTLVEKEKGNN